MSTNLDFIEFISEQIEGSGCIRYKKMFGEYMIYVNDKPILLVCNNTVYVKQLECITSLMNDAEKGYPYKGAKEHFIVDIDDATLAKQIIAILEPVTSIPKPKKKKST